MPLFRDIPQFIASSGYRITVGWDYLPSHYAHHVIDYHLNVDPDFQRAYVWSPRQKARYVEYILRGGQSGRDLWFNCPGWQDVHPEIGEYVIVDGKQRLDAVLGFLNNEFPIFDGHYRRDYTDSLRISGPGFHWNINTLKTRDECLEWYCDLNRGGTVHADEELIRVKALIGHGDWEHISPEEIQRVAGFHRPVIQQAIEEDRRLNEKRAASAEVAERARTAARTRRPKAR